MDREPGIRAPGAPVRGRACLPGPTGVSGIEVRSKGIRTVVLALLVAAVAVRAAYAAPALSTAQLRAVSCCHEHRGRLPSTAEAGQCCQLASQAGDPALMAPVPALPPPSLGVVGVLSLVAVLPGASAIRPIVTGSSRSRDGPPLFLRIRTLRL